MSALPKTMETEKRRFQRISISLLGRFMRQDRQEYPCQTLNMSPGDVALVSPIIANMDERIICYLDHIGRIEGRVARVFENGFALRLDASVRKRERLVAQLTWFANRDALNLPEDRRHDRVESNQRMASLILSDGERFACKVIDISMSGAAVTLTEIPPIGSPVTLGHMRGRIVRHFEGGVAIEFSVVMTDTSMVADRIFI